MLLSVLSATCKLNLRISNLDEKYKTIMFETFFLAVLGIDPGVSHILGEHFATEIHPQSWENSFD